MTITHPDQIANERAIDNLMMMIAKEVDVVEMEDIDEPIFRDVGQALYVAYLFCGMPASPKSPMFTARELVQDGAIEPAKISGIHFGEHMSALEIRGECANVVRIVESELSGTLLDAIVAKYAHGDERVLAMARLRDMLCAAMNAPKAALTRIVARRYGSEATKQILSDYAIAGAVGGISHDSVRRARKVSGDMIFQLEVEAIGKLAPVFVAAGVSSR